MDALVEQAAQGSTSSPKVQLSTDVTAIQGPAQPASAAEVVIIARHERATGEAVLLMYATYLPLRERIDDVDGWVLVPATKLDVAKVARDLAAVAAVGLARPYSGDDRAITRAFAYRESEGLGTGQIDGDDVLDMHRTLVMLVLDGNPSQIGDDEQEGNQAYSAMTSDNALIWGHRIA